MGDAVSSSKLTCFLNSSQPTNIQRRGSDALLGLLKFEVCLRYDCHKKTPSHPGMTACSCSDHPRFDDCTDFTDVQTSPAQLLPAINQFDWAHLQLPGLPLSLSAHQFCSFPLRLLIYADAPARTRSHPKLLENKACYACGLWVSLQIFCSKFWLAGLHPFCSITKCCSLFVEGKERQDEVGPGAVWSGDICSICSIPWLQYSEKTR